jgi:hypothetical protein
MSRSRVLLLLIVVLFFALWYAWKETPRQQRVGAKKAVSRSTSSKAVRMAVTNKLSALDFTDGSELKFNKPKRDIFRPLYRAPAAAKKVSRPKPIPVPVAAEPAMLPLPEIVPPAGRVPVGPKPIPPLNVLGFLRKGPKITAFLSSQQGDVYLVKKGDRFADGIIVQELDESRLVLSRGAQDPGTTLVIREQKTQSMQFSTVPSDRPAVPAFPISRPIPKPRSINPVDATEKEESAQ